MSEEPQKSGEIVERNPDGTFKEGHQKMGGVVKGAKKRKFIDEIDEMLDEMAEGKDYTYRKALKKQLLKRMIVDGDAGLLKEYWQQKDGKPKQPITGGDDDDNPISIISAESKEKVKEVLTEYLNGNSNNN